MNKHTPGPWAVAEIVKTARIDNAQMIRPVDHCNYEYGATAIIGTNYANARLIAAAPELLAALQGLLRGIFDGPDEANAAMLIAKARDAINKATGEN
jgi:hypothetical protein